MRVPVVLPRLVGNREAVRRAVDHANLPPDLEDEPAVILANRVASLSAASVDELVKQLLEDRGAERIVLVGAPPGLKERLSEAVSSRRLPGSVTCMTAVEAGV